MKQLLYVLIKPCRKVRHGVTVRTVSQIWLLKTAALGFGMIKVFVINVFQNTLGNKATVIVLKVLNLNEN